MTEHVSGGVALELMARELKNARMAKKLSLDDASQLVSIQKGYLGKIESGDFSFLPKVYVFAHVKAYARALGVGNDEAFEQCRKELQISNPVKSNISSGDTGRESRSAVSKAIIAVLIIVLISLTSFFAVDKGYFSPFFSSLPSSPWRKVLVVRVVRDYSWVKVVADDGAKTYAGGKLSKGQELRYKSRSNFRINVDRPECVELYLNGKKVPPFTAHFLVL
jgi:transcriptional regulator with XRE-family HTH domain